MACYDEQVAIVTESGHLYTVSDYAALSEVMSDAQPAWSLSYNGLIWAMGTNSHEVLLSNGSRIQGHLHNVPSVAWNGDLLATASIDGSFAIWHQQELLFQLNISEWAWSVLWIDTSQIEIDADGFGVQIQRGDMQPVGGDRKVLGPVGKRLLIGGSETCLHFIDDSVTLLQLRKLDGIQRLSLLSWCSECSCLAVGDQPQGIVYLLHFTRDARGNLCYSMLQLIREGIPLAGMTMHRVDNLYTGLTVLSVNGLIWQYRIYRQMGILEVM